MPIQAGSLLGRFTIAGRLDTRARTAEARGNKLGVVFVRRNCSFTSRGEGDKNTKMRTSRNG